MIEIPWCGQAHKGIDKEGVNSTKNVEEPTGKIPQDISAGK